MRRLGLMVSMPLLQSVRVPCSLQANKSIRRVDLSLCLAFPRSIAIARFLATPSSSRLTSGSVASPAITHSVLPSGKAASTSTVCHPADLGFAMRPASTLVKKNAISIVAPGLACTHLVPLSLCLPHGPARNSECGIIIPNGNSISLAGLMVHLSRNLGGFPSEAQVLGPGART